MLIEITRWIAILALGFLAVAMVTASPIHVRRKRQNYDALLHNKAFVESQLNCVLRRGQCDRIGNRIKILVPEVIQTKECKSCTEDERGNVQKVADHVKVNYPKEWNEIRDQYHEEDEEQENEDDERRDDSEEDSEEDQQLEQRRPHLQQRKTEAETDAENEDEDDRRDEQPQQQQQPPTQQERVEQTTTKTQTTLQELTTEEQPTQQQAATKQTSAEKKLEPEGEAGQPEEASQDVGQDIGAGKVKPEVKTPTE